MIRLAVTSQWTVTMYAGLHHSRTVFLCKRKDFTSKSTGGPQTNSTNPSPLEVTYGYTVIPRLTKIIRSGITFVSRNVILTSRCLERKQPSRVGGSPLCDVISSFLCHKHTDGKHKLLEWPDRSCLLLYVSARIH